jgi:hypothetical protein
MMTFDSLQEARKYVAEMSPDDTAEIGDASVLEYINGGDIEIVAEGEEHSDTSEPFIVLGKVCEVLY